MPALGYNYANHEGTDSMPTTTLHRFFLAFIGSMTLLGSAAASAQMEAELPTMNFHRINERLATGGRLLEGGAAALKEQGVTVVINLRDDSTNAEEAQFVEQGIQWINIPVVWRNPENENFARFSEVMREHQDANVLVQCSSNYRASALTYLYQVVVEGVPDEEARQDVLAIWDPSTNSTWTEFLDGIKSGN